MTGRGSEREEGGREGEKKRKEIEWRARKKKGKK